MSRPGFRFPLFLLLLALGGSPQNAWSHAEPYSWVELRITPEGWGGRVTAHIDDLSLVTRLATPESLLAPAYVARHSTDLHRTLDELLHLEADGSAVRPHWTEIDVVPERRAVAFEFRADGRPPASVVLRGPLFRYDPAHETYFNVYLDDALRHQDLLDAERTQSRYNTGIEQRRIDVVRRFVAEGIHHIFIGPDHILFVVALLFLGGKVGRLLKIVTAFTLAHSVTLAIAALGILSPPSRLVEPAIALSIVFVGADNLMTGDKKRDRRALVAGCFGLVHGFGFASVLRELGLPRQALAWSLLSFNVGVEIGQACIVLTVAPLLAFLRARRPAFASRVVQYGSLLVVAAGAYWFVRRAFLA